MVALMWTGFGLVGLHRFIINPLFPVMQKDLGLDYQDLGLVSGILALTSGTGAVLSGRLSDRYGRRQVMIPAIVIFSLLVAATGLATGLISLLIIRALMGWSGGAYVPASIVTTVEVSEPTRVGLNLGLQQTAGPLFGLGLAPLIGVGLLAILPSWPWVFGVVALPGLVTAVLLSRTMRHDAPEAGETKPGPAPRSSRGGWSELLRLRAVVVNTLNMGCLMMILISLGVFVPSYLTDHLHLTLGDMGKAASGLGLGGLVGAVLLPMVSDRLGCRPVMVIGSVVIVASVFVFSKLGPDVAHLFLALFVAACAITGNMTINVGPLTSAGVPKALVASATGVVTGVGEILGGAVGPALIGIAAQWKGIEIVPAIVVCAAIVTFAVTIVWVRDSA